jgi:hypothetical protein
MADALPEAFSWLVNLDRDENYKTYDDSYDLDCNILSQHAIDDCMYWVLENKIRVISSDNSVKYEKNEAESDSESVDSFGDDTMEIRSTSCIISFDKENQTLLKYELQYNKAAEMFAEQEEIHNMSLTIPTTGQSFNLLDSAVWPAVTLALQQLKYMPLTLSSAEIIYFLFYTVSMSAPEYQNEEGIHMRDPVEYLEDLIMKLTDQIRAQYRNAPEESSEEDEDSEDEDDYEDESENSADTNSTKKRKSTQDIEDQPSNKRIKMK